MTFKDYHKKINVCNIIMSVSQLVHDCIFFLETLPVQWSLLGLLIPGIRHNGLSDDIWFTNSENICKLNSSKMFLNYILILKVVSRYLIMNNIGFFRAFHRILILQCLSVFFLQTSFLLQISIFADNWWESIKTLSLEHKTFNLKYWNKIFSPFKHSMGKGRRKSSLHVKDEKIQV